MSTKTIPADKAIAVTPSDTVNIVASGDIIQTRGLYIGVAGNVSVEMADPFGKLADKTVVFTGVLAGTFLPISITRVNSTLTTATTMTAVW